MNPLRVMNPPKGHKPLKGDEPLRVKFWGQNPGGKILGMNGVEILASYVKVALHQDKSKSKLKK